MSVTFLCIENPPELNEDIQTLFAATNNESKEKIAELLIKILDQVIELILQTFFIHIMRQAQLSAKTKNKATKAINVLKKIAITLMNNIVPKMSRNELLAVTSYIQERLLVKDGVSYTAYPVNPDYLLELKEARAEIERGGENQKEMAVTLTSKMTAEALDYFIKEPLKLIKLSLIARKMSETALNTLHKTLPMGVGKIMGKLDQEQILSILDYFDTLLIEKGD